VLDLHTGATKAVIPTGTGLGTKTPGIRRADELCYNSESDVVLVANDDPVDNFVTFIAEDSFKVLFAMALLQPSPAATRCNSASSIEALG
jgi:hypothetical protein